MRIALIGPGEVDGRSGPVWDTVRAVMNALGPQGELVHTGGPLGGMVDSIARRAKGEERRRLPRIDVQQPELVRYDRETAFKLHAAAVLHGYTPRLEHRAPDAVVYIGYALDDETRILIAMYEEAAARGDPRYSRTKILAAEDFVAERSIRP